MPFKSIFSYALVLLLALTFSACTSTGSTTPLLRAEPAVDSILRQSPRTLRLYFSALPDVSQSSLSLFGPAGEYQLRGLHTMAADDLMIEILDTAGEGTYTVEWTTRVGDDPTLYSGSYQFTIDTTQR